MSRERPWFGISLFSNFDQSAGLWSYEIILLKKGVMEEQETYGGNEFRI